MHENIKVVPTINFTLKYEKRGFKWLITNTTMKTKDLRTIMCDAWSIFRATQKEFAECLRIAWRNFKLRVKMQTEIVRFFFTKIDGTIREAWGTLKNDLVPETKGIDRKKNENVFTYFDIEKNNWRSCKKENILI